MLEATALRYQSGFGNEHASEAHPGVLPIGQNSPQRVAFGLYAEQLSGTPFTAPRERNRRSWLYRLRPSAAHAAFAPYRQEHVMTAPSALATMTPNRLRWDPLALPTAPIDFVDALETVAIAGDARLAIGLAIHQFACDRAMADRVFACADGELLIVAELGILGIDTEFGRLVVEPGAIGLIPRGIKFRVDLPAGPARGYVAENYGEPLRLPDLGPIGANGLANARDFEAPTAAYEDVVRTTEYIVKYGGAMWRTELDRSPLDVVAWHGSHVPYRYDLARFNTMNTVSFDHPDPSIFTVLTSPSAIVGTANLDFVIFPPRWLVAEHTFRPPWFHRNVMSEYMGLVRGTYDAKATGFVPGGASLHSAMSAHGPDATSFELASNAELVPRKLDDTLAFMFETRYPLGVSPRALGSPRLQRDYDAVWRHLTAAPAPSP